MITADTDLGDFDDEGDAMHVEHHVSIHEGRVWLSPMALDDIEFFTGQKLSTEHPREVLQFLDEEAAKLQGPTISEGASEMNYMGFCLMKGIRHAIEMKMFGPEHIGDLDPMDLQLAFVANPRRSSAATLH
jgi:hypothetical protein